jgi:hypothetical protein
MSMQKRIPKYGKIEMRSFFLVMALVFFETTTKRIHGRTLTPHIASFAHVTD